MLDKRLNNIIEKGERVMRERKFSRVTKWEIALGAVASLMTGVVVGLVVRQKRKRAEVPPCPPPHRPLMPPEEDTEMYYGTVEEKHVFERDMRRPPRRAYGETKERYRTPHELGGKPHTRVSAKYEDTNRYTGNRHK